MGRLPALDHRADEASWLQKLQILQQQMLDIVSNAPTFNDHPFQHVVKEATQSLETSLSHLGNIQSVLSKTHTASAIFDTERNGPRFIEDRSWPLSLEEYKRYGRQLILPEVKLQGQLRLKAASVLVVGVGGLGCPAAAYLAGAGVGRIGLMDGDFVEVSNLHRQILHSTSRTGHYKVDSAMESLMSINPLIKLVPYRHHLNPQNALEIFSSYDLILDCTDHPTSRYLISDVAVILQKVLISASALRTEGQLIVLNNPPRPVGNLSGGPCYRCIYPKPPPPASLISCGEGGILGPVVGTMGVLQALEAIKILLQEPDSLGVALAGNEERLPGNNPTPSLLMYSAFNSQPFRSVRMRGRRPECQTCSAHPTITADVIRSGSLDYVQFCGLAQRVNVLNAEERLTPEEYSCVRQEKSSTKNRILLDVREPAEFSLCSLEESINIPISEITDWTSETVSSVPGLEMTDSSPIYVICRLGNDSQLAVKRMKELGMDHNGSRFIGDIKGGFKSWKEDIDPSWPEY